MVLIVVTSAVVVCLAIAAGVDLRARRRGHRLRGSAGWNAVRESRRDQRAGQAMNFLGSDTAWTASRRRNEDASAQQRREDQR